MGERWLTAVALLIAGAVPGAWPLSAFAQVRPLVGGQRAAPVAATATIVSPAEGEVVSGDLQVVVEVPPGAEARRYSLEVAYWDPGRGAWVYPGLLGEGFDGGPRAIHRVPAALLARFSTTATRWQLRARVSDPPWSWGPWRIFGLVVTPGTAAAEPPRATGLPAVQGRETPPGATAALPTGRHLPSGETARERSPGLPAVHGRETTPGTSASLPTGRQPPSSTSASGRSSELPAVQGREPPTASAALPVGRQSGPVAGPARSSELPVVQGRETTPGTSAALPSDRQPPSSTSASGRSSELPAVQGPETTPGSVATLPTRRQSPAAEPPADAVQRAASPALAEYLASPAGPTLRLKLWNGIGAVDKKRVYVDGPVDVDWERKDLKWWFECRVSGSQRAPVKLRWELSKATFPAWGEWHPVPGFGLTGPVEGAKQFQVDLEPLAPRPPGWAGKGTPLLQKPTTGTEIVAPDPALGKTPEVSQHLPDLLGQGVGGGPQKKTGKPAGSSIGQPPTVSASGPGGVQTGQMPVGTPVAPALLSLYLRVVSVDAAGAPVGPASNAVELRFGPQEKQPPFQFQIDWPEVGFAGYRAVRPYDFDWQCWVVASQDWVHPATGQVILAEGTKKNLCAKEDTNILEDIADTFGSFVELLGDFVNWVSDTYASLKSELISAVASAIPGCSGSPPCQGALEMGLNAGLAAVGMPPELPDFEQLQAMGEGYLVDMMAQQAAQSGVPFAEDAAREALHEMIAQGKEAMTSGGVGSSLWIPDVSRQYKPLLVTVRVTNPLPKLTTAVYLEVAETGSTRYLSQTLPVPPLDPQESYEIAVALQPTDDPAAWMELLPTVQDIQLFDLSAYMTKTQQAQAAHQAWEDKYTAGDVKLKVSMRPQWNSSTGYQVAFQKTCQAGALGGCLVE